MLHIYPDFYDSFHCLAASCPDSCCAAWTVVVDDEAARRYARVSGALGDDLRRCMEIDADGDRVFRLVDDRCPFWDLDGLCRIQRELGEEALCHTCAKFPRLTQDYGGFIEHGLTLACPEAARLILSRSGPRQLTAKRDDVPAEETDLDPAYLQALLAARQRLLDELWDGNCREEEAVAVCLLHAVWFQDRFDGFNPAPWDKAAALTTLHRQVVETDALRRLIRLHQELEILTPQWGELLLEAERWQYPLPPLPETNMARNLAEEYLYRYWLQSANDDDCTTRMCLMAVNWLMVGHLARIHLAKTGRLSQADLLRLFQLYAKEVEHDEVNREALMETLMGTEALGAEGLARLILSI